MSSDYQRGYRNEGGDGSFEYDRGRRDAVAGHPSNEYYTASPESASGARGGLDTTRLRAASVRVGEEWARDPNASVNAMIRVLFAFTVLGGVLGFFVGNWLHDSSLWLPYTRFFFFFDGLLVTSWLLGVTLVGRGTKRGTLTLLFVGGCVAFMIWSYMLYPAIFIHIR
jgi:hypothetical protein